jgi:hypothetical protein
MVGDLYRPLIYSLSSNTVFRRRSCDVRYGSLADKPSPALIDLLSAVTPIADKPGRNWIVRFVPLATNAPQQTASLFDHLVGAGQEIEWDG